ncbi:hypothetical protein [Streptomyces uncialis]
MAPAVAARAEKALVALVDGICLQALLTGADHDEEYAREALSRVVRAP